MAERITADRHGGAVLAGARVRARARARTLGSRRAGDARHSPHVLAEGRQSVADDDCEGSGSRRPRRWPGDRPAAAESSLDERPRRPSRRRESLARPARPDRRGARAGAGRDRPWPTGRAVSTQRRAQRLRQTAAQADHGDRHRLPTRDRRRAILAGEVQPVRRHRRGVLDPVSPPRSRAVVVPVVRGEGRWRDGSIRRLQDRSRRRCPLQGSDRRADAVGCGVGERCRARRRQRLADGRRRTDGARSGRPAAFGSRRDAARRHRDLDGSDRGPRREPREQGRAPYRRRDHSDAAGGRVRCRVDRRDVRSVLGRPRRGHREVQQPVPRADVARRSDAARLAVRHRRHRRLRASGSRTS